MTSRKKRVFTLLLSGIFIIPNVGCKTSKAAIQRGTQVPDQFNGKPEQVKQVFDQYVERVRWSRYWLRPTRNDDTYVEDKQISVLVFWTKTDRRPKWGLCSSDLSLCIANHSSLDNPRVAMMRIDSSLDPKLAFASFAKGNYGDGAAWFPSLVTSDFEFEEKSITLPSLGLPSSILHRVIPQQASREADRIRKQFVCWNNDTKKPSGCAGTQVFAYYSETDLSWYLLRTCSSACDPEFRGDAIEALSNRKEGWAVTIGGFTNTPEDIEWFKPRILKAKMFQFTLP